MKDLFTKLLERSTDPFESIMETSIISPQTQSPIMGGTVEFASDYMPPSEKHPGHDLRKHCDEFGDIIYNHDEETPYSLDEIEKLLSTSEKISEYIKSLQGKISEPESTKQEGMPENSGDNFNKKDIS